MAEILVLLKMFVFPGFLFLAVMGLIVEFIDRKLYARLQNRQGPPWFQPFADFFKLIGKEEIIPEGAPTLMFRAMPIVAATTVVTSSFYIPLWSENALFSFNGDLIVVLYLLTIPTITFFLAGWFSVSLYSMVGAIRSLTQLFSYEVPLFLVILAPAMLANTWSISEMTRFYSERPLFILFNIPGFLISIVALLGKLEKVPFDIPEAETEIVGGSFTEYTGRNLAFFRMAIDMEAVVGASLVAAVFFPFGLTLSAPFAFLLYLLKIAFIVFILAVSRTIFARLRIDQMVDFCWKYLAPAAFLQFLICLIVKGVLL